MADSNIPSRGPAAPPVDPVATDEPPPPTSPTAPVDAHQKAQKRKKRKRKNKKKKQAEEKERPTEEKGVSTPVRAIQPEATPQTIIKDEPDVTDEPAQETAVKATQPSKVMQEASPLHDGTQDTEEGPSQDDNVTNETQPEASVEDEATQPADLEHKAAQEAADPTPPAILKAHDTPPASSNGQVADVKEDAAAATRTIATQDSDAPSPTPTTRHRNTSTTTTPPIAIKLTGAVPFSATTASNTNARVHITSLALAPPTHPTIPGLVALGTSSGSVYIYERSGQRIADTFITNKIRLLGIVHVDAKSRFLDAITALAFFPQGQRTAIIAAGTARGSIIVLDTKLSPTVQQRSHKKLNHRPRILLRHRGHQAAVITLVWNKPGTRVYSGDTTGAILRSTAMDMVEQMRPDATTRRSGVKSALSFGLDVFRSSSSQIHHEEREPIKGPPQIVHKFASSLVQMDMRRDDEHDVLLASCMSHCALVMVPDATDGKIGVERMGQKERHAPLGAIFVDQAAAQRILAVRPGRRVWHVSAKAVGAVESTTKFTTMPRVHVFEPWALAARQDHDTATTQRLQFGAVQVMNHLLLGYAGEHGALTVSDVAGGHVVAWFASLGYVFDVAVDAAAGEVFVLHAPSIPVMPRLQSTDALTALHPYAVVGDAVQDAGMRRGLTVSLLRFTTGARRVREALLPPPRGTPRILSLAMLAKAVRLAVHYGVRDMALLVHIDKWIRAVAAREMAKARESGAAPTPAPIREEMEAKFSELLRHALNQEATPKGHVEEALDDDGFWTGNGKLAPKIKPMPRPQAKPKAPLPVATPHVVIPVAAPVPKTVSPKEVDSEPEGEERAAQSSSSRAKAAARMASSALARSVKQRLAGKRQADVPVFRMLDASTPFPVPQRVEMVADASEGGKQVRKGPRKVIHVLTTQAPSPSPVKQHRRDGEAANPTLNSAAIAWQKEDDIPVFEFKPDLLRRDEKLQGLERKREEQEGKRRAALRPRVRGHLASLEGFKDYELGSGLEASPAPKDDEIVCDEIGSVVEEEEEDDQEDQEEHAEMPSDDPTTEAGEDAVVPPPTDAETPVVDKKEDPQAQEAEIHVVEPPHVEVLAEVSDDAVDDEEDEEEEDAPVFVGESAQDDGQSSRSDNASPEPGMGDAAPDSDKEDKAAEEEKTVSTMLAPALLSEYRLEALAQWAQHESLHNVLPVVMCIRSTYVLLDTLRRHTYGVLNPAMVIAENQTILDVLYPLLDRWMLDFEDHLLAGTGGEEGGAARDALDRDSALEKRLQMLERILFAGRRYNKRKRRLKRAQQAAAEGGKTVGASVGKKPPLVLAAVQDELCDLLMAFVRCHMYRWHQSLRGVDAGTVWPRARFVNFIGLYFAFVQPRVLFMLANMYELPLVVDFQVMFEHRYVKTPKLLLQGAKHRMAAVRAHPGAVGPMTKLMQYLEEHREPPFLFVACVEDLMQLGPSRKPWIVLATTMWPAVRPYNMATALQVRGEVAAASSMTDPVVIEAMRYTADADVSDEDMVQWTALLESHDDDDEEEQEEEGDGDATQAAGAQEAETWTRDARLGLYFSYLSRLAPAHDELCKDPHVLKTIVALALAMGAPASELLFLDGESARFVLMGTDNGTGVMHDGALPERVELPRPGSMQCRWPESSERAIAWAMEQVCHVAGPADVALALSKMLARAGHWRGLQTMHLASRGPAAACAALDVCILADDVTALDRVIDARLRPMHGSEAHVPLWRHLLEVVACKSRIARVTVGATRPQLELTSVIRRMTVILGSVQSLALLTESDRVAREVDMLRPGADFYSHFLRHSDMRREQLRLTYAMMEGVDSYLWERRASAVPPQVRHVVAAEVAGKASATPDQLHPAIAAYTQPLRKTYEDASGPWGVRVDLTAVACTSCGVALVIPRESDASMPHRNILSPTELQWGMERPLTTVGLVETVTVFRCGHAFHRDCLTEHACVRCSESIAFKI